MEYITHTINSVPIGQRSSDGYVNLTKMIKAANDRNHSKKQLNHYLANQATQEFLEVLSSDTGIPVSTSNGYRNSDTALICVKRGGVYSEQGTWGHPRVAIHCAQWCSPEFAVLVTDWVLDWMNHGASNLNGNGKSRAKLTSKTKSKSKAKTSKVEVPDPKQKCSTSEKEPKPRFKPVKKLGIYFRSPEDLIDPVVQELLQQAIQLECISIIFNFQQTQMELSLGKAIDYINRLKIEGNFSA